MPFIPVDDAIEVRLLFTLGSAEEMVNVLHFHNLTPVPITQLLSEEIALLINAAWVANLQALQSTEVAFAGITVKDISAVDLPVFRVDFIGDEGTAVGDPLPYQTSLVATLRTQTGGRGGRGRTYIGGFVASGLDTADRADAAVVAGVDGFMNDIQNMTNVGGDAAADFNLGVVSRYAHVGGDPLGAPIAPVIRDVSGINVNRRWDTQRRRSNKLRV